MYLTSGVFVDFRGTSFVLNRMFPYRFGVHSGRRTGHGEDAAESTTKNSGLWGLLPACFIFHALVH